MADKNVDEKQIVIQKLYIKDSSFESPNTQKYSEVQNGNLRQILI